MSNPTELPDLDRLDPCPFCGGPARIESSAMWLDLICDHDKACILDGDSAEMSYQHAAGSLEAMVAKWNHRAQPEGAAPCDCCADIRAAEALHGDGPEGEAPQAEMCKKCHSTAAIYARNGICSECGGNEFVARLKPTAQHAESGAPAPDAERVDAIVTGLYRRFKDWSKRGFSADDVTWCEVKADVIALIAAQSQGAQAKRLTEAECEDIAVTHAMSGSRRGSYYQFDKEGLDAFALDIMGRTSAPGTPEAPSDTERMDWLDQNIFHRGMDDLDAMRRKETWMWVTFAPKGVQGTARSIIDAARAAQLDGGQEGSESNG